MNDRKPSVEATVRDDWTIIEVLLPVPGDWMHLSVFARIEDNKLVEWTTRAPAGFSADTLVAA